jgi:hypothetical protein
MAKWADYSFTRPSFAALKAAGVVGVSRYLCWVNTNTYGKIIFKPEYDGLLAAGIDVILNWEFDAQDELGGASSGSIQATEAVRQAKLLGYPAGATIYFSGDFDETPGEASTVAAYFQAAAPIVHAAGYRIGVYGDYYVVGRLFDAKLIDDAWQTYAWSGGQWDPRANMRQTLNGVSIGGQDADLDQSVGVAYSAMHPYTAAPSAPPVLPGGGDMKEYILAQDVSGPDKAAIYVGNGMHRRHIKDMEDLKNVQWWIRHFGGDPTVYPFPLRTDGKSTIPGILGVLVVDAVVPAAA